MLEQESLNFGQEQSPRREFLGWDAPLLGSLTQWLLADERSADLASTLVVVPTANSGRRLRMALSEGGGVISPHVVPPHRLFEVDSVATRQESLWAWARSLQQIDFADFPNLFPNRKTSGLGFSAALSLARQLSEVRDRLSDAGVGFKHAMQSSPEKDRWKELSTLEASMLQKLDQWNLTDPCETKIHRAANPELPSGITQIVVAAVPDPSGLALKALQSLLGKGFPITVLVYAPESLANAFDVWGVPGIGFWKKRVIDFPDWKKHIHVLPSSREAAELGVKLFAKKETTSDNAAIALCDPTLAKSLEMTFQREQWPLFNPDGKSLADSSLARIVEAVRNLCAHPQPFDAVTQLVSIPGAEMFLPEEMSRYIAVTLLDDLHVRHLPETLKTAKLLGRSEQRTILDAVSNKLSELEQRPLSNTLTNWLKIWLGHSGKEIAQATEDSLANAIDALVRLEANDDDYQPREAMEMIAEALRAASTSQPTRDTVMDLQGWLEIAYDPAPHMILAGMHEECVPDGSADDPFVPDSLRKALGLRDADGRFARDAYLLESTITWRSQSSEGDVDVLVTQFTDSGEARKPSRLLMLQEPSQLPERVQHLFAELDGSQQPGGAWKRDWPIEIPVVTNPYADQENLKPLHPTAIRSYLSCPMRFYLKYIVGMQRYDAGKREMAANDFGTLCHNVLDQFGQDDTLRNLSDANDLTAALSELLDNEVERIYGPDLTLPLMVQTESARERLKAFASQQVLDHAQGWRILHTEFPVGNRRAEQFVPWSIAGHPIRMTPDRIDRHEDGSQWRIWDYKTSAKAARPDGKHLKSISNKFDGDVIAAPFTDEKGKSYQWADVQLPLYGAFAKDHFKLDKLPAIGYINLPRSTSEVGFSPWDKFTEQHLESALEWAAAAIGAIQEGIFSPASELSSPEGNWDDFAELAPDGLAQAIEK